MKIAKKTLSVLLSIMIIVTSISVCFTTFAATADDHDRVKDLVEAAAATGAATNSSGNAWTFSGTDSVAVWDAAEALFDYATTYVATSTGLTIGSNDSDASGGSKELANQVTNDLGLSGNENAVKFINNVLNPSGTDTKKFGESVNKDQSGSSFLTLSSISISKGSDITSDSHAPADSKYPSLSAVTKTVTVNRKVNEYLMSIDSLDNIPDSGFATTVVYKYVNSVNQCKIASRDVSGRGSKTLYADMHRWHNLSSATRTPSGINTAAKTDLTGAKNYFQNLLDTTKADFLSTYTLAQLLALRTEAEGKYNTLTNTYTLDVMKKHIGDVDGFLINLNEAIDDIYAAADNMRNMIAYINAGFTPITSDNVNDVNIDEYTALYAQASAAYNAVKDLPDSTIASVQSAETDLASFSKATSKQWLDSLNESISLYNAYQIKATIDAFVAANADKVSDSMADEDVITNEEVAILKDTVFGLETSFAALTETAKLTVFGTTAYAPLYDIYDDIVELSNVRGAKTDYTDNFYQYFAPKMTDNIGDWKNATITARYDEALEKKAAYEAAYANYKALLGDERADAIFANIVLDGEAKPFGEAIDEYIESLKVNIIARNDAQLDVVQTYSGIDKVDFNNLTVVKNATDLFDGDLYTFVEEKGWLTTQAAEKYSKIDSVIALVDAFVATGGIPFEQKHNHDASGVFTVRPAGSRYDDEDFQIGYPNDIARDGEEDDYIVDEATVNATIAKLDKFLTSEDFCALVGLKDKETGEPYGTLSEAISNVLKDNLFTNEMVNTIVKLVFPMIVTALAGDGTEENKGIFNDLSTLAPDIIGAPTTDGSAGKINLNSVTDAASGTLELFLMGHEGTSKLEADLDALGLKLYPRQLATLLGAYPEIQTALNDAGINWNRVINSHSDENGNLNFDWGVTDYDSFINVVGIIFNALAPLLRALIAGQNFTGRLPDKAAYATSPKLTINDLVGSLDLSISNLQTYATVDLTVTGQNLFKSLWIPIIEALGINDDTGTTYTFKSIPASNATGAQIADAMFDPVLTIVDQLAKTPVDKILSLIPTLMYCLSMDKIQGLLNGIDVDLCLSLQITDIKRAEFGLNLSGIANIFKDSINGLLPKIPIALNLGSMLNISDLLGFSLSNLNSIIGFVMEALGAELELPVINAGAFTLASQVNSNAASQRWVKTGKIFEKDKNGEDTNVCIGYAYNTNAKRTRLVADKADVLYMLLDYLMTAVGSRDTIEGIVTLIGNLTAQEGEEPTPIELPDSIYDIINNIGGNTTGALAAIIELLNPQTYDTITMDWVNTDKVAQGGEFDPEGIPYLEYGNDWTREKAESVLTGIDDVLNAVVKMIDKDSEQTLNEMLQGFIFGMFTNENFTGFVEMLVKLGYLIDNDALHNIVSDAVDCDIRTWAATFGELFPDAVKEGVEIPDTVEKITGITYADGVWSLGGAAFEDGDSKAFVDLFTTLCAPLASLISAFFSGKDVSLFEDAITIKGYKNYANSVGVLFEILGIAEIGAEDMNKPDSEKRLGNYGKVLTQAEYDAMAPEDAFNYIVNQLFTWLNYVLSGNTVERIIELIPRFTYFIESNGLSVVIHNLLMPILVILDDIRPIIDIDINTIASTLIGDILNQVSDAFNNGEEVKINLDIEKILNVVLGGDAGVGDMNTNHKTYNIDLNHFTMVSIMRLMDTFLGTSLEYSQLNKNGIKLICSQPKVIENSVIGEAYGSSVSTVDALTIFITSFIEALQADAGYNEFNEPIGTNGEVICEFINKILDTVIEDNQINAVEIYNAVINIINGLDIKYKSPDWGYMFDLDLDENETVVNLPELTINYLQYDNDWDKETAQKLDETFDALVDAIIKMALPESDLAQLLNGVLEDNVYTDANLKTIVELLVNAIAGFDVSLRDLVDATLDTNIGDWFKMCTYDEAEGKYVLTDSFGVDNAANKKKAFISGIKKVLAPANELLAWLFFADDYKFLTGSTGNDVITIAGGKGYAYGLVPILEALGCKLKSADEYKDADGKYDVGAAVEDILNAVLTRVDEIAGKPAHEVLALIPNVIYFINANGISTSLNNLLACLTGVLDQFAPVLKIALKTDDVSLGALVKQIANIDIDITDLSMGAILDLVSDLAKINISDDIRGLIETFYIGELKQFVSANGEFAYTMQYNDKGSRADMITIIISIALDLVKANADALKDLVGEDIVDTIMGILNGIEGNFSYADPNWAYMYEGENALANLAANGFPNRTGAAYANYTKYTNNWNDKTAEYLANNLNSIVNDIINALSETDSNLGTILEAAIAGNIYKDDVLNAIIPEIVKLLGNLDEAIITSVGAVLGADVDKWFDMCEIERDADSKITNVTCTKNWGIDAAATTAAKKTAFVNALTTALEPANRIIAWLFLGQSYTFFNDINGDDVITIAGGEGYAYGIVPLLEALGCNAKPASAYKLEKGYDVSAAVGDVATALLDKIAALCSDKTIDVILDLLPNLVYFINAGGVSTVVGNILAPVEFLLGALESVVGEVNIGKLIEDAIGIDIKNITFATIFDLVTDLTGITFRADSKAFVETFYMGKAVAYTSANGRQAYKMAYSETETRRDMLTILLSLVIENVKYADNKEPLEKLLGEDVYGSIYKVLTLTEAKAMQEFSWLYTEYADTNKTFSAIETSTQFQGTYNDIWTREKAQYIADRLPDFVDDILCLLGFEINGVPIKSLKTLIDEALNGNLYTQANADSIIKALSDLAAKITELEPYGKYIIAILDSSLGVDLTVWDRMTVTVKDGDRESFANALSEIVAPLHPILAVLLAGEDLSFFYDIEGKTQIVIPGSEGYAYGIIPLLEALGCTKLAKPAKFKQIIKQDPAKAVKAVIDPVLDRLEYIEEDPANRIFDMIPAVVYFIDSNGLDTCVNNIVNSVDTVLAALSPIIGKSSIMELLGLELKTYNFEWLVNFAFEKVEELTGYDFKPLAIDPIAELTTGKVVSYISANGERYYTMKYASNLDRADMITVILRLVVKFALMDENRQKVKDLFKDYITDEKSYQAACDLIDFLAAKLQEDPAMSGVLFVIYYIFFGLDKGFDNADKLYHNVNDAWKEVLKGFDESGNPYLVAASKVLKQTLNKHLDGIFDEDGVASDGALSFFARLKLFFQKIGDWFRNLFKRK